MPDALIENDKIDKTTNSLSYLDETIENAGKSLAVTIFSKLFTTEKYKF